MTDASGQVSMYDPGLSNVPVGVYVHYSVGVSKIANRAFEMVINHSWSVFHNASSTSIENIVADVSTAKTFQLPQASAAHSSVQSDIASPNTVGDNNCYYYTEFCWVDVAEWSNVWTTIGEGTGTGYMTDMFTYGQSSAATIAEELTSGNGWSVSGSTTQSASSDTTWAPLHGYGNWYANTQFYYVEEEEYACNPWDWNSGTNICSTQYSPQFEATTGYVIFASYWQQSDESWGGAGQSSSSPGSCLSISQVQSDGLSWSQYAANSQHTINVANGYGYSSAAYIGNPQGGPAVTISDSTYYQQHTNQAFTFGAQYSYYYLYTNGYYSGSDANWPVIFSTTSAGGC